MVRRIVLVTGIVAAVALGLPAVGAAQVFFRMDYSAAAFPNGGWGAEPLTASWTRAHIPGGGPSGQNAIELRQLPNLSGSDYGGQFNWGNRGGIETQPAQGVKRYYRWRMWFSPDSNFRGASWDNGQLSNPTNKLFIVGQGCGSDACRVIMTYQGDAGNQRVMYFRLQIDGGESAIDTTWYPRGQWLNIQLELDSSTTGLSDGGYKIWVNNNDYTRPTAQRSGIVLRTANWGFVWLGGFMNDGLLSGGVHTWRHADFEASTAFDSSWSSGSITTLYAPAAPQNIRIVR